MPILNGRLTCCVCGSDLGSADDPGYDPDCAACQRRQEQEEYDSDAEAHFELELRRQEAQALRDLCDH